ncbi:MAG TPA: hypothetical protein VF843_04765 [Streptosporangiaceae bacterium]
MGLRKQQKPGQGSDWISPGQMLSQLAGPGGGPGMPTQAGTKPVPAGLRPLTAAGPHGDWWPGALHLAPGSIRWQPGPGLPGEPVELAAAMILPPQGQPGGRRRGPVELVTNLQVAGGWFQLEMDPVLFEMTQEMVSGGGGEPWSGPPRPGF